MSTANPSTKSKSCGHIQEMMNRHNPVSQVMKAAPNLRRCLILVILLGAFFFLLTAHQLHSETFPVNKAVPGVAPVPVPDSKLDPQTGFLQLNLTMKIEDFHEIIHLPEKLKKSKEHLESFPVTKAVPGVAPVPESYTIHLPEKLKKSKELPTIYFITPTYKRPEQPPDLTRLAQTLMHVPSLLWFVIEDAHELSPEVNALLRRSKLNYVHMKAPMPDAERKKNHLARGVSNRNKGLEWIRQNEVDPKGVVYFGDDDNTYDLRLFPEIRSVRKIGMWPVGLLTQAGLSSPLVQNGTVTGFYDGWVGGRKYPVDMAEFAVSVEMVLNNPNATFPFIAGYEEDGFLKRLNVTLKDIEAKADNCTKIYVWHTRTRRNMSPMKPNQTIYEDTNIMDLYKQIK